MPNANLKDKPKTSYTLAEEYGVNPSTIQRDARFSQVVDILPEEAKSGVLRLGIQMMPTQNKSFTCIKIRGCSPKSLKSFTVKEKMKYNLQPYNQSIFSSKRYYSY